MGFKDEIASDYTARILKEHGKKKFPNSVNAIITGAIHPRSIGTAIAERIENGAGTAYRWKFDVIDGIQELPKNYPDINTLILSHGQIAMGWLEDIDPQKVSDVLSANLLGSIRMVQDFVKLTIDNSYAKKIVVIGSMAHEKVLNGSSVYCASKAGLAHFCRCAAFELAPKGYSVYCIHPSNVADTPMTDATIEGLKKYRGLHEVDARAYWRSGALHEKPLQKEEIVDLVMFLLTSNTKYSSGTQFNLAGGAR